MKTCRCFGFWLLLAGALRAAEATPSHISLNAQITPPAVPAFFAASAEQTIRVAPNEITSEIAVSLRLVQGRPETISLGLSGDGEVVGVTGAGLRDWSVRQGAEKAPNAAAARKRFLDVRPLLVDGQDAPRSIDFVIRTRLADPTLPGRIAPLLLAPGEAVGFALRGKILVDPALDVRFAQTSGVIADNATSAPRPAHAPIAFATQGEARLELALARRGAASGEVELSRVQLAGKIDAAARVAQFVFRAEARVERDGARLPLLAGRAALTERTTGDGWHVERVAAESFTGYELVFDRKGAVAVELGFVAALGESADGQRLDFRVPAGAIVPLTLTGLAAGVQFDPARAMVPAATATGWQGFLPADGAVDLGWRQNHEAAEGALSFTSAEQTEVRVGAGLLRQSSQIAFRILQGRLPLVRFGLDGPEEIVGVEGTNVLGWKVLAPAGAPRVLEVQLSRPFEGEATLRVRSQAALATLPARAEPLRLTPEGGVRHGGFVRIANDGAVRLEIADTEGLLQLAPAQFPGGALEPGARQVFVYRFPAASYRYRVLASPVLAEVGVSQLAVYQLGETDRILQADLELDVREAPLRDWSLRVPADYAVVGVQAAELADYAAESGTENGYRTLKLIFARAIEGRHLVRLRLEKNQPAAAGAWALPPLQFPGAKSVRGHIGVLAAAGYRISPAQIQKLAELPLSYFPQQIAGLQQAWRVRDSDWSAAVNIEALGQSVQADVFHLYALKQGEVAVSVLLNYFVVGAPASEWRIEVPASARNIDLTGQGARRDWRREGHEIIVPLQQPVLGAATLLVTFSEEMSARGGTLHPGAVRPLNVQSERGFVQVVSPLQVKHRVAQAEGLLKLDPLELPTEYKLLSSSPSLVVYQYPARPFALDLALEWYQPAETVDQVVDFAQLASQVSRDGQFVTEARYFVKTRGHHALRLQLGAGVQLWEARVDNEIVTARADGDWTLVPLPARLNPNQPALVALRLGQANAAPGRAVRLRAPLLSVPLVLGEWSVRSDPERLLVPHTHAPELAHANLTETGFEWIATRAPGAIGALLALLAAACWSARSERPRRAALALVAGLLAAGLAAHLAFDAAAHRRVNRTQLTLAATVVPAQEPLELAVENLPAWRAMLSGWGAAAGALGLGVIVVTLARSDAADRTRPRRARPALALGFVLLAGGLLAQRFGAPPFFVVTATLIAMTVVSPALRRLWRERRAAAGPVPAPAALSLFALILITSAALGRPAAAAESLPPPRPLQSFVQRWEIREGRLFARAELQAHGAAGETFLLLKAPAVLTGFAGDGLKLAKTDSAGEPAYEVALVRDGLGAAQVTFELPAPDLTRGLPLLTGPAALQRIAVSLDQPGWEFRSPLAVQVARTDEGAPDRSSAELVLGLQGAPLITLAPRVRDTTREQTQFFVEAAQLYVPAPGVVNGFARVTVRPVQGRVGALALEVPAGFTVGEVNRGPVGRWRFDPAARRLHVAIEPAQAEAFSFVIETQRAAGALPLDLALSPLRVAGAAGEIGMLALAFTGEAQPEALKPAGLSPVSVGDFDAALLPRDAKQQPLATLQSAFRYGRESAALALRVTAVAPEVRVTTKNVLSLGDDRLVLAVDLHVAITRAGLFRLSFAIPAGLEVEALSGPALSHWTESEENGRRIATLHLHGRTLGEQVFAATLVGPAPRGGESWPVPRLLVREATRQTGELQLVPEQGIRLRAVGRAHVSELDPRTLGDLRPGALAFRLLQEDWSLVLGVEALEPWITVQALQEITAREGQTLTRLAARYRIENAAVKQLRVRLPGLNPEQARSIRATGPAVSDFVPVPGADALWEIRFPRGVVGETAVQIEFQGATERAQGRETVATPVFEAARQVTQFVALRGAGRLEIEAPALPRGWQRIDWTAVPAALQNHGDRSVPALAFRVAEPEQPLTVVARRHEIAEALKLRVTRGTLTTLLSPRGPALTAVELQLEVAEKSTLRARLPAGARLYNTTVNGESAAIVREGDAFLFHVAPGSPADHTARVRFTYATTPPADGLVLNGPGLDVPLENVAWRVVLPPGHTLASYGGALRLDAAESKGGFGLADYQAQLGSARAAHTRQAADFLQHAATLLQRGDQQQASEALNRAFASNSLDEASNEDARVQLRALKTQQAILGLNTRRQRLYFDHSTGATRNEQLEQAANLNPFMRGKLNFDPRQVDQLLMGNSAEENTALRGIASRIVEQQLAAEPAPAAIDVTLPERGQVLTFTRRLQVDGTAPLRLELRLSPIALRGGWFAAALLGAIGVIILLAPRAAPWRA